METHGPALSRRLSGVDAAFLYLERKEIPLAIAGVCIFDGEIPFDQFVASIDAKLHLLPRYRQIAVAPPFNLGYPSWQDDPNFDIGRHIFRTRLTSPGNDAELEALAGRILSQVMDRGKPLWDIHVVDGLSNGRGALIARVHHALADGIAGASIMNIVLDPTPEGSRAIPKRPRQPRPQPAADYSLTRMVTDAVHSSLQNLISAEEGVLEFAQALSTEKMRSGLKGLAALLPEVVTAVERLPFNRPCTGERKFCWAEFDFSEVQGIRAAAGGTINDVILTVLTRAIGRYVELHGQSVVNRLLRVICPVNLRRDNGETLGNRISFLPVVLPMDVGNPVEMLQAIALRTEIMKRARAAELLAVVAGCLGTAPPPVQALLWRGFPEVSLPLPLFNIICTNVPGSRVPLYSVGRRMLASYPQVPTGYELGVGCAAQSYAGKLCFGLIADAQVAPDVARLRDYLYVAFDELRRAAKVKKTEPQPEQPRRAQAAPSPRRRRKVVPPEPAPPVVETISAAPETPAPEPEPASASGETGEPAAAPLPKARSRRAKPAEPVAPATLPEPSPEPSGAVAISAPETPAPEPETASASGETGEPAAPLPPRARSRRAKPAQPEPSSAVAISAPETPEPPPAPEPASASGEIAEPPAAPLLKARPRRAKPAEPVASAPEAPLPAPSPEPEPASASGETGEPAAAALPKARSRRAKPAQPVAPAPEPSSAVAISAPETPEPAPAPGPASASGETGEPAAAPRRKARSHRAKTAQPVAPATEPASAEAATVPGGIAAVEPVAPVPLEPEPAPEVLETAAVAGT